MILHITGYLLMLLMGGTLGMIGAGGSILTVPILVYLLQVPAVTATGYSLPIVGIVATIGALHYRHRGQMDLHAAFTFALPALIMVFATRWWLLPALPASIMVGGFLISKDTLILALLAALMLASARFMLNPAACENGPVAPRLRGTQRLMLLVTASALIGMLTGLVGAGGGFLIVPALLCLFGLTMHTAIGTSLLVIAVNAFTGFAGDLGAGFAIDWPLLGGLLALTLAGMGLGTRLNRRCDARQLRRGFGWLTLAVAAAIIAREIIHIKLGNS